MEYQREIAEREVKETGRIIKRMRLIAGEIAEENDFDAVIEVNEAFVVYWRESLDITNELVRRYDQRHSARSKRRTEKGAKALPRKGRDPPTTSKDVSD